MVGIPWTLIFCDAVGQYRLTAVRVNSSKGVGSYPCISTTQHFERAHLMFDTSFHMASVVVQLYMTSTTMGWSGSYKQSCTLGALNMYSIVFQSCKSISMTNPQDGDTLRVCTTSLNHGAYVEMPNSIHSMTRVEPGHLIPDNREYVAAIAIYLHEMVEWQSKSECTFEMLEVSSWWSWLRICFVFPLVDYLVHLIHSHLLQPLYWRVHIPVMHHWPCHFLWTSVWPFLYEVPLWSLLFLLLFIWAAGNIVYNWTGVHEQMDEDSMSLTAFTKAGFQLWMDFL